jgi:FtsP/CotA-like multicopper oxidase with cupredoxin domain
MPARSTALAAVLALSVARNTIAQGIERVRPNDNRARAGVQGPNAVAVRMEAKLAMWHPDGDDRPGVMIPVFAELGRAPQVPGPLIRAQGGTDVIVMVRNSLPGATLTVHGLHARPAIAPAGMTFSDSVMIPPGQLQTLRFRLDRPGTYFYWATTAGRPFDRRGDDSQLSGAIVVDEPGERTPRDRVFVIGMWNDTTQSAPDSVRHRQRELTVINGRAWPAAERVQYEKGEIARWRVINASPDVHPMHLHGYYYRVTRRGDTMADTALLTRSELAHTERVGPGGTYSSIFTADKLGTFFFHCADPAHFEARGPMGFAAPSIVTANGSVLTRSLGGLATAMEVTPQDGDTSWKLPPVLPPYAQRRFRMLLRPNVGSTAAHPTYGIALNEVGLEPAPVDSGQRVGPTLVLNRGEPVSVWVVNNLPEPTSITWHGIEGESLYDGVPGVSGAKAFVLPRNAKPLPYSPDPRPSYAPLIAPNDSFEVRLQPPRLGTFAYHAMSNASRQIAAGIVGAVVVAEKGKYDPLLNVPVVISSSPDSATDANAVLVNGSVSPAPIDLKRGGAFRIRAMTFASKRPDLVIELRQQDTTFAAWRPVARDGIEMAAADRVLQPARALISTGQMRDYEFLPIRVGDYRLEVRTPSGTVLATQPIRVY